MEYMKEKYWKEKEPEKQMVETDFFYSDLYRRICGYPVVLPSCSMGFKENARQYSASWLLVNLTGNLACGYAMMGT